MPPLTQRDLRAALRFLATCDAGGGLHALATSITAGLPVVIASDITVFGMVDPRRRILRSVEHPHVTSQADLETYIRLSGKRGNPMLTHFAATSDPEARRMTDFLSRRQFCELPLYIDFYRGLGVASSMGILIENSPSALDGISLNRGRREFDDREQALLTLLRPHLVQAIRTARAIDRLRADLDLALQAIEVPGFGIVVLGGSGRVRLASRTARVWLDRYFGRQRPADRLSESLDRWVRFHSAAPDSGRLPPVPTPLVLEGDRAHLVVRIVAGTSDTLLLLEERTTGRDRPRFTSLGLSAREAETLEWVAAGKTSPEIAGILGVSRRTVQTYLERVFRKLGVETRAAAVARALGAEEQRDA